MIPKWKRDEIIRAYKMGNFSNLQLAKTYGVTNTSVRNILIREGVYVPQRSKSGTVFAGRGMILGSIIKECDRLMNTENYHELWLGILSIKQYAEIGQNTNR